MARTARGSDAGDFDSGIAARAGAFLEINYIGSAKDKRIARDFAISPGMAKMLRGGRGWTVARLDQLVRRWPAAREFVFAPPQDLLAQRLEQLAQGFQRLGDELAALRSELRGDIAALREDVRSLRGG